MRRLLIRLLLAFSSFCLSAQSYLEPSASVSFGLNHHTNRDTPYFINTDTQKNLVLIGTTEKDSTFTDVVVIKLDTDHNSLWKQIISFETDLSYDIPLASFLDSNNELTILNRSSSSKSLNNGVIFLTKLSADGELLFKKRINTVTNSNYIDYEYIDWGFETDGTLSLTFIPKNVGEYDNNVFHFVTVSNQGNILKSFFREIDHSDITSKISNGDFYFLVREPSQSNNQNAKFNFVKITSDNELETIELLNPQFNLDYQKLNQIDNNVIINVGTNNNYHLTSEIRDLNGIGGTINITLISNSSIEYSISSSSLDNYNLVSSYYNENGELITAAKESNSQSTRFISVDGNNEPQVIKEIQNFPATIQKFNRDGSTYLIANGSAKLLNEDLTEINSIILSGSTNVVDISKIDNEKLGVIGYVEQSIFPSSNYRTQIDIVCDKLNSSRVLDTFLYSGQGTSRVFQEKIIIDKNDNYYVLVAERLGPSNFGIGGTKAPINNRIIKYDPELKKVWEKQAPEEVVNLIYNNGRETNYFFDDANDLYLELSKLADNNEFEHAIYKVSSSGNMFNFLYTIPTPDEFYANDEFIYVSNNGFTFPANTHIFKIEKISGNLVSDIEVGNEDVRKIFTNLSGLFYYTLSKSSTNEPDIIKLYKDGNLVFSRVLS
jgi:hypothetical protein